MSIKNYLLLIVFFLSATITIGSDIKPISANQIPDNSHVLGVDNIKSLYYLDKGENFVLDMQGKLNQGGKVDSISLDGKVYYPETSNLYLLENLEYREYSIDVFVNGKVKPKYGGSFKFKEYTPLITNDAVVLGLLLLLLAFIFRTEGSSNPFFKKFYRVVPALLLCYFLPAFLNTFGIVSADESNLYFVASRYLLPASLVLLCLNIDVQGIKRLGPKALIMFFTATVGIVIGGPIALWIVSKFSPDLLNDEIWRGLATVAGSWIGGGANQTAMKEVYLASDQLFSAMIVVDVFVANVFMSVLLFGTGYNKRINKFFKADDSAIESLKNKMESFQKKMAKVATFKDLMMLTALAFVAIGLAHFLSNIISPSVSKWLEVLKETSPTKAALMSSFGSGFFWLVVFSTIFGIGLSFTKAREFEGIGASKIGTVFLYLLVATIGMKMDILELINNWGIFKFLISIGLIWITIHAIFLFIVAKIIKAPFFYVAVGSQANIGGAASAPVVAAAFSPSLAPVGVLLAVLGYAVGTFGAIACALMMQYLSVA
jgi:uncharacterized membrane protein|tara:strand:+ start:1539 stop:3170 length:1632 start_codon:yes stop_codon:yes gene_type:complete